MWPEAKGKRHVRAKCTFYVILEDFMNTVVHRHYKPKKFLDCVRKIGFSVTADI